ncbi:hypothetical protein C8R45DRAFT_928527 [Mycena sanguinolenta]|nr:hypothetical protein C8R45DRAFT_928527 [Mycena sanguinolenta]
MPGLGLGFGGLGLHIPQARARALGTGPEALSPGFGPGFFRAKKKKATLNIPWVAIIVEAILVNQSKEKLTPKPYRLKEMASARKIKISRPGLAGPGRPGIPQAQALGPPKPCVGLGPA